MVSTPENEGVEELVRVLGGIGLVATEARTTNADGHVDAVLRVGNRRLAVEVRRDVRENDAQDLVAQLQAHSLVVADRFSPRARILLDEHHISWLDRRGHLRLVLPPGIFIDRDVDPLIIQERGRAANAFTPAGLDVAIALLLQPAQPPGVREISRRTATSAGRVSQLLREFRAQGLVNRNGTPAIPELFEAVADAWDPKWVALGGTPGPDPTLRLGGIQAASRLGVPLVVTDGWPSEFYVRDEFVLRRLVRTYQADRERTIVPIAKVAVCPSPYGFDQTDPDAETSVVNHVVVALDLAQDQGRGREALDQWNPEGVVRVW
jgi:hypothetical protein